MANCPHCGLSISDWLKTCPDCGKETKLGSNKRARGGVIFVGAFVVAALIGFLPAYNNQYDLSKCGEDAILKSIMAGLIVGIIELAVAYYIIKKLINSGRKVFVSIVLCMFPVGVMTLFLGASWFAPFSAYTGKKCCDNAISKLKNLAIAQESYYVDFSTYAHSVKALPSFQVLKGGNISISKADDRVFTASAIHQECVDSSGKPKVFTWDSANGGAQW